MIKRDELAIWKELWKQKKEGIEHPMIVDIGKALNIPEKRVCYIAEKWASKGLIDYGVSARTGWIDEGITEKDLKEEKMIFNKEDVGNYVLSESGILYRVITFSDRPTVSLETVDLRDSTAATIDKTKDRIGMVADSPLAKTFSRLVKEKEVNK